MKNPNSITTVASLIKFCEHKIAECKDALEDKSISTSPNLIEMNQNIREEMVAFQITIGILKYSLDNNRKGNWILGKKKNHTPQFLWMKIYGLLEQFKPTESGNLGKEALELQGI